MLQFNLLLSLFLFGFFMNQSDLYTSFGFISSQPVLIGLILFFQLIYIPYAEVPPRYNCQILQWLILDNTDSLF